MYNIHSSILWKSLYYLLKTDKAEIPEKGNKELKSIVIGNQTFRYNKNKDISSRLNNESVKKTNEYWSYDHKIIYLGHEESPNQICYQKKVQLG